MKPIASLVPRSQFRRLISIVLTVCCPMAVSVCGGNARIGVIPAHDANVSTDADINLDASHDIDLVPDTPTADVQAQDSPEAGLDVTDAAIDVTDAASDVTDAAIDVMDAAPDTIVLPPDLPLVNETQAGRQWAPAVAALDDGFLVAWFSTPEASIESQIMVRIYEADGTPRTGEKAVSPGDGKIQSFPSAAGLVGGGAAVAWRAAQVPADGGSTYAIEARLLDAQGDPIGQTTRLTPETTELQEDVNLARLGDGNLVLAWSWSRYDGDSDSVVARILTPALGPVNANFILSETTHDAQTRPWIAPLVDGGFLATWDDYNERDAYGRFFGPHGEASTGELPLEPWDSNGVQWMARGIAQAVDDSTDGAFVTFASDPFEQRIVAKLFGVDGTIEWAGRIGENLDVSGQAAPVAAVPEGVLVAFQARATANDPWAIYRATWRSDTRTVSAPELVYGPYNVMHSAPEAATLTTGSVALVWECQDTAGEGVCAMVVGD